MSDLATQAAAFGVRYHLEVEAGVITLVRSVKERDTDRMAFGSVTELAEVGEWMMSMADSLNAKADYAKQVRASQFINLVRSCVHPH